MENKLPHPAPKGDWKEEIKSWFVLPDYHDPKTHRSYPTKMVSINADLWADRIIKLVSQLLAEREKEGYVEGRKDGQKGGAIIADKEFVDWLKNNNEGGKMVEEVKKYATLSAYKVVGEWAEENKKGHGDKNGNFYINLKPLQSFLKDKTK